MYFSTFEKQNNFLLPHTFFADTSRALFKNKFAIGKSLQVLKKSAAKKQQIFSNFIMMT
jgi:hypothetical protein